jgi:hypothetical protein
MKALWASLLMLLGLGQFCPGPAAILEVPGDHPGIQSAMDASSPGDTVHVAPGTWFGLYTSPTHSLILCSDYLFTRDSTDINETILDGEYAGTILDLVCEYEWFTLCGFTIQHGLGQDLGPSSQCDKAGAVQVNWYVNATLDGVVFRENHAPQSVPVLYQGGICSGSLRSGALTLRNIACYNNTVEQPTDAATRAILINIKESTLIVDGLYYDGGGTDFNPLYAYAGRMDSVLVNNVHIVNSLGAGFIIDSSIVHETGQFYSNLRTSNSGGPNSCPILIYTRFHDVPSSVTNVSNIQVEHTVGPKGFRFGSLTGNLQFDSLSVSHCRSTVVDAADAFVKIVSDSGGTLRNVHFHHNTSGDSTSLVAKSLLYTQGLDIDGASFHDNRAIVPADPDVASTGGNYIYGGMLKAVGLHPVLQNLEFVNNRVDDLDDYSFHNPIIAYYNNPAREMAGEGWDSLTVRNVQVRHSRQPNHCPEVMSADGLEAARPGETLGFGARHKLVVDNILLEDVDDGGMGVGADSLWVSNVVMVDVGRFGLLMGRNEFPLAPPYYSFRSIHIENVDAVDNFLPPQELWSSNQAALFIDVRSDYNGIDPVVDFENVTVTGCDGMQGLFTFYEPVDLHVRNCLFWNNTYDHLVGWDDPINQTWEYNILQEPVPGIGNQVGVDPWFDEELGAPWLSPISPAIDAGHPDLVYNDIEDPDNPDFALWPSQGTLRNDIGYTGGPYAGTLDHLVSVRPPITDRPTPLPQGFTLNPTHPNPFNPSTTLSYTLARPMQVELSIYNLLGQQVRTLAFGVQDAGEHSVPFTAGELASGVYVVEMKAGGLSQTQKVLLLK